MSDQQVPTQSQHPWRTVARTLFQLVIALASLLPVIALAGDISAKAGVVQVLAVCAAITRLMAMPVVNDFLRQFVPWLAADKPMLDASSTKS